MSYPRLSFLALPYSRLELPGWGPVLHALKATGLENDQLWKSAPSTVIRDKRSGYRVRVELSDWSDRYMFFLGRHYDLPLQLLMSRTLKEGGRFVDVGANVGAMTLQAAALVGARGRVDSFEPNPACRARLEESLARNRIGHVRVHPVGLSDAPGRLVLSVITAHAGMGTLAEPRPDQAHLVTGRFKVEVCCGDGILLADPHPVRFVKIDVEGFELRALQGLRGSLERWLPLVVTEMQRDWLARAGTTRSEVFRFMAGLAYTPFGLATQRRATRHRLALQAIGASDVEAAPFDDFAWLHPATRCSASLRDALM